jgi:hypothetical protein
MWMIEESPCTMVSKEAPMELLETNAAIAETEENECPLCGDMEPNDELLEAFEEVERMKRDPSLHRGYASVEELFAALDADVDD